MRIILIINTLGVPVGVDEISGKCEEGYTPKIILMKSNQIKVKELV